MNLLFLEELPKEADLKFPTEANCGIRAKLKEAKAGKKKKRPKKRLKRRTDFVELVEEDRKLAGRSTGKDSWMRSDKEETKSTKRSGTLLNQ